MNYLHRIGQVPPYEDWTDNSYTDNVSGERIFKASYRGREATREKITVPLARKVIGLALIERELRDVNEWLYLVKTKTTDFSTSTEARVACDEDKPLVKALWRAAIVTYAKPFVSGKRPAKLEKKDIEPKLLHAHLNIMLLRHKFIAHADNATHEFGEVALYISPLDMGDKKNVCINTHQLQLEIQQLPEFITLVQNVLNKVTQTLGAAFERLTNEQTQTK